MARVRDILKGGVSSTKDVSPQVGLDPPGELLEKAGDGLDPAVSADRLATELIAERLRLAADQRAALAQGEIGRLQLRIDHLQTRLDDLASQNLPRSEVQADLEEARGRLGEAEADLTRAYEARQNTDLASSHQAQGHQSHQGRQAHLDHDEEFMRTNKAVQAPSLGAPAGTSVRNVIGGKTEGAPVKMPGFPGRKL